jgi:heme/copper-type cytochrome/quinol oxidase subunit 3
MISPGVPRQHIKSLDVSALPDHKFGHQGLIWWGTAGFMLIEGLMFVLALVAYYYFRIVNDQWPPSLPAPWLMPAAITTLLLLVSIVPNQMTKRHAERYDLKGVRLWLVVCILFAVAASVSRAFEFTALNSTWNQNAYASIVWVLLGLHTSHLVTDLIDTVVLTAIVFTNEVDGPRFVDVSENGLYWYFVVGSWVPIGATLYLAPGLI